MNYQEFKEAVIKYAADNNVKDYELYYDKSADTSVEIFMQEIKGFTTTSNMGLCFRCVINGQTGYASTENMTNEEAESIVLRAIGNAQSLESETPSFIHKLGDTYLTYEKENIRVPSSAELIENALALQNEIYKQDSRVIDGTQAVAGSGYMEKAIFNSNGLDLSDSSAFDYLYGYAIVSDGKEMYTGIEIASGKLDEFDKTQVAKEAVKNAVETIGYTSVDSGEYTIVFSNKVMSSLLGTYSSVFSAEAAQKGLSLLKDKEGEMIAAPIVTLTDDPLHPTALTKATFDDEGAATYPKNIIENGKFTTFLHNLATASKAGVKTTGNGYKASNASTVGINHFSFFINPGSESLDTLFEKAGNGLYITSVEGMHAGANPITGDFSLSSGGFRIEDGKKTTPVKGITISGNFLQLMKDISCIGEDLRFSPGAMGAHRCGSPSVLVPKMNVAGK